jgi:hypothetical protein
MSAEIIKKLAAPFEPHKVHWRVGSTTKDKSRGLALCYLNARDVMDRLDEAIGSENWQDAYEIHGARVICKLSLRIGGEWVAKSDGAGDTVVEAEKGSISDAFKRAAVKWGIGRYLYNVAGPWVALVDGKRIAAQEAPKLAAILPGSVVEGAEDVPRPANAPPQAANPPAEPEPVLSDGQWEVVMGAKIDLQAALNNGGGDQMAIVFTEQAKAWEEAGGPDAMAEIRRIAQKLSRGEAA